MNNPLSIGGINVFSTKSIPVLVVLGVTLLSGSVRAEVTGNLGKLGKLGKLEKAASVFKTLYDVGSSVVTRATDYAVYSSSAQLERYSEKSESWDHGSKESVERVHWVDEVDGTSKYRSINYFNDIPTGSTSTEAFPHGWGNCTLNCGIITSKDGTIVGGQRTTIRPTKFRLQAKLDRNPQSTLHLCDPIPVWYVFQFCIPSSSNSCEALYDSTLTVRSLGYEGRAFINRSSNQVLDYPITNSLSQSGAPSVFIAVPEK